MGGNHTSGNVSDPEVPPDYLTLAQSRLSVEQRIELASKPLVQASEADSLSEDQHMHRFILQLVVRDAEVRVRQALAETLADNLDAPHDIVLALANDVDLVASPVLSLSDDLTPTDLIAIIENMGASQKMLEISGRKNVPADVCAALIELCDEANAERLLQNIGANIPESGVHRLVDRHRDKEEIQKSLIERSTLPATVIERVIALVTSELLSRLVERHQ